MSMPEQEDPGTHYFRLLVPTSMAFVAFGTRNLKHWIFELVGC